MSRNTSRRRFLKQTVFGTVALSLTEFIPASESTPKLPPGVTDQLLYFSAKEFLIMQTVSERIVGRPINGDPTASQIGCALRADKFLATADTEIQEQFHQLLTVFNSPFFTFLFDLRFSSFVNMNAEDQDSYLEDWMTSTFGFRRTGFQALKRTCLSMFYTDEHSWNEIGFQGMGIP
jgi:hypothetical protein